MRQAIAARDRSAPLKVTGKLKVAIDAMVWEGLTRPDAAKQAGLTDHGVRTAFGKPHVKGYYRQQIEMLRTSELARNIRTYVDVRDNSGNAMARIAAAKALDGQSDQQPVSAVTRAPGVVVIIQQGGSAPLEPSTQRIAAIADHTTQVIENIEE